MYLANIVERAISDCNLDSQTTRFSLSAMIWFANAHSLGHSDPLLSIIWQNQHSPNNSAEESLSIFSRQILCVLWTSDSIQST